MQIGGPVGSMGLALSARMAAELGLAEPALPWHTIRVRPGSLAAGLGVLAGVLGKVARDVTLLAQSEVGEAHESADPGAGGSSAMAHKRNPAAAVSVLAYTKRVPGLVATMLAAMEQEHQRAAGAWQAEWGTLTELLDFTAPFQEFITRHAWGAVWTREGLDLQARSMITLSVLTALGRETEIAIHVRGALRNGLSPAQIAEVLIHTAVYAGVAAANAAFAIAQRVIDEAGESEPDRG